MTIEQITDPTLREAAKLRRAADLIDGVEGSCVHYLDAIETVFLSTKKRTEYRYLVESSYHFEAESFEDPGYHAAADLLRRFATALDGREES